MSFAPVIPSTDLDRPFSIFAVPVDARASAPPGVADNGWLFDNASPMYDHIGQMQPLEESFGIPGQDLLFGFMSENMPLAEFDVNDIDDMVL